MSIVLLDTDNAYLAIRDLLSDDKRALLARTHSGPIAIPPLEDIARRLAASARRGKPYAAELAVADQRHDIAAVVLDHICQIHELLGALPEYGTFARYATRVRGTLSMERTIVTASYGQAAANAHRNRLRLPEIEDVLDQMPAIGGVTAYKVAEIFIRSGEEIGKLLSQRADVRADENATRAEITGPNLLHEARDLLLRTRSMIANEVSLRPDLPADLTDRIFSVLDERIAVAAAARARARPASGATDPATDPGAAAPTDEPVDGEGRDGSAPPPADLDGGASDEDR